MDSRYAMTSGQRNGIFGLVVIIVLLLGVIVWRKNQPDEPVKTSGNKKMVAQVRHFIDSLKKQKTKPKTYRIYPFNPNFITDYKGYKLGMSPEEIDRLHSFRKKDEWIDSNAEFQEVTGVSDSLLAAISVYFEFPDWVIAKRKRQAKRRKEKAQVPTFAEKSDLNTATFEELVKIKGIGDARARRILRYRKQIGGFVSNIQLRDVYLDHETMENLLAKFTVKSHNKVKKLDINKATTAQLSEVIYFNYELARKIVQYRITHEGIRSFNELAVIRGFPIDKIDRVKLYLKIKDTVR